MLILVYYKANTVFTTALTCDYNFPVEEDTPIRITTWFGTPEANWIQYQILLVLIITTYSFQKEPHIPETCQDETDEINSDNVLDAPYKLVYGK